jgi:hypothetical protein
MKSGAGTLTTLIILLVDTPFGLIYKQYISKSCFFKTNLLNFFLVSGFEQSFSRSRSKPQPSDL